MVDRPIRIGNWEPENYGGRFHGEVTLRTAFAQSLNSVAVQLADKIGIPKTIETAHRLGVQSDLPAVPSLALGSADVTLIEMTRALAALAANADNVEPYAIDTVQSGDRVVFARQKSVPKPPSNPAARAAIGDLLAAVVREGTNRSRAATPSINAGDRVGCLRAPHPQRSNPHRARCTTTSHFPRFRPLEVFVRRPPECVSIAVIPTRGNEPCAVYCSSWAKGLRSHNVP
jgi:cell division protein FtsI/penicillin-binding protein 2